MYNNGGVVINKAIFVETGTYNDMMMRPFTTNLDANIVRQFSEVTNGGRNIAPTVVSGVAGNFLKPDSQVQGPATVDNGWDTTRLRFIIELVYPAAMGGPAVRKILQGYTGYTGVSHGGFVDPKMPLYFNNVLTLRQTLIETPHGRSYTTAVSEANHLLRGDYHWDGLFNQGGNTLWTMRPEDVFTTMSRLSLGSEDLADLRLTFAQHPIKKSRRSNASASHYVAGVLDGFRKTMDYGDYSDSLNFDGAMANAKGIVQDDSVSADPFFSMLTMGETNFKHGGFITYGELCAMFPDFDNKTIVSLSKNMVKQTSSFSLLSESHTRGQTEHWVGMGNETIWATALSQSVPSLMMDLMLTQIGFAATNQTLDSSHEVTIFGANSFADGIDLTPYIEQFITRLKVEVLRGLSSNNLIDYNLQMVVDVVGETRLTISIAGGPPIDYTTPSFADALFAPVLTSNMDATNRLAFDMQSLAENVGVDTVHGFGSGFQAHSNGGGFSHGSI